MNIVTALEITGLDNAPEPRHTRLFELIRQKNLGDQRREAEPRAEPSPSASDGFARSASQSLLPQEQRALGITASFGR